MRRSSGHCASPRARALHVHASIAALVAAAPLAACAPGATPCVASPAPPTAPPASAPDAAATSPATPPAGQDADVTLLLRPTPAPAPLVHVELTFARTDPAWTDWRITGASADHVHGAAAHDASGEVPVSVSDARGAATGGVVLHLGRAPSSALSIAYDVLSGDDAPDDPLGLLVLDDRFRGAGEKLVALPDAMPDARANVVVRIDTEPLRVAGAASSFGVGAHRRTQIAPRALRYASFVAGSLGVQVIDDPGGGHDEGAWLGATAFDPRPTIAELAEVRSSLRDLFKSSFEPPPWTFLLVAQTRPLGSFTTTPRAQSSLLQVGPGEPWSAALRLSMAQQLARTWVGGILRLAAAPGHAAEGAWFDEGVSRYAAMALLARAGLMSPDDVRDAVGGELSVLATSPYRTMDNTALAEHAREPVGRATLMARGAMYALEESAALRTRTKGARGLDAVLVALTHQVEQAPKHAPLPVQAWIDALATDDPDAAKRFDAHVVRGEAIALPAGALGPCFRAGTGDYVAFDPGFDLDATRVDKDGKVIGLRPDGPAAKAGLREGDVVESLQAHEGDAEVPVKMTVTRAGAKVSITFTPRGAHGRGQTWNRLKTIPDDRCAQSL